MNDRLTDIEKEESLNNKIEKAIRFNDFNEAIRLCTLIAEDHKLQSLNEVDKLLHQANVAQSSIAVSNFICSFRAKKILPFIAKIENENPELL